MKTLTHTLKYRVDFDGEVRIEDNGDYRGYITTKTLDKMFAESLDMENRNAIRVMRGDR